MEKTLHRFILSLLLISLVSACVTTKKGGFDKAESVDEAVTVRVAAAKQYLRERDFESARRHLKFALELDNKSPDVHDALALTFHASGELELAEKHYQRAVDYGDGRSRYRINYANYLFGQNAFKQAEKQLLAIADDSLYEKREAALVLLGLTQQQLLQQAKAMQSFERALVLNPNNRRVLRELSIMNYDAREYAAAWRYFQQYRNVTARPSAEMLLLGIQLARELDEGDAEASYELALKNLYPESREYQSYLRDMEHKAR